MDKNREDSVKTAGEITFRGQKLYHSWWLSWVYWLGWKKERQKVEKPWVRVQWEWFQTCVQKHVPAQRFLFFSSFAFCHLPSLCSLLKCPSRQFALCFGLQESTLQSCVDPICGIAFDFALHLCTSWVIKRQERGQRNVRCISQPQTHIVQLGCCQSPMCHLHF